MKLVCSQSELSSSLQLVSRAVASQARPIKQLIHRFTQIVTRKNRWLQIFIARSLTICHKSSKITT